ncbi:hypothetical protein [uncultured Aquimarina sp.]|uniref:hypothetical protein n=1 Tax=uncultured Aquimarina sp. TaxID=575652 RepID=UPI002634314A|nr:hypothetical protein [uncultured Aquimarina sp.]
MVSTEVTHKVQLVDGVFTPSEASDVINSLIREKVNFHKLHRLSICEGDMHSDTKFDDSRVSQLLQEKENFKPIYKEAMLGGKRVKISGVLNIEIID